MIPLKRTVMRMIDTMVMTAVNAPSLTQFHAAGARLNPISATIAPVTTGGMTTSIHRAPAKCTTTPTRASVAPVAMMPPCA